MSSLPEELPSYAKTITSGQVLNLRAVLVQCSRLYSLVVEDGPAPAPTHHRKAGCNDLPSFASP